MRALPDPNCEICNGSGHIYIDGLNSKRCRCLLRSLYAAKLGRLFRYKTAKNSKLLSKLDQNLFLVVGDDDIGPHLKAAFIKLGLNAQWAYVTDSDVLQAWLGQSNSINASNLSEVSQYPFLVLRLGVQGYKNVALSGVLSELLMSRALNYQPTWIVSPRALTPDCLEYSDELDTLIRRYFTSNSFKQRTSPSDPTQKGVTPGISTLEISPRRKKRANSLTNANDILRTTMKRS